MKIKSKPIFIQRKPIAIKVYRAKFRPFESTKYLNEKALKAKKKVTIECGTVEFGDVEQTVAVEIRKGMIVALKPIACAGCSPRKPAPRRTLSKDVVRRVQQQLADRGLASQFSPIPLRISRKSGITIPIGDDIRIWIIWGDACIIWWNGPTLCWWCLFLQSGCITF